MAFNKRALVQFGSVPHTVDLPPVTFYQYAHGVDTMATIIAAGYFNDARDKLKVNDHISLMAVAAGVGNYGEVTVTAAPATGNVTVAVDTEAA